MKCAICQCVGISQEEFDFANEINGGGFDSMCVECAKSFAKTDNHDVTLSIVSGKTSVHTSFLKEDSNFMELMSSGASTEQLISYVNENF